MEDGLQAASSRWLPDSFCSRLLDPRKPENKGTTLPMKKGKLLTFLCGFFTSTTPLEMKGTYQRLRAKVAQGGFSNKVLTQLTGQFRRWPGAHYPLLPFLLVALKNHHRMC